MYNILIIDSDAEAMQSLKAALSPDFNAIGLTSGFPATEVIKKKRIHLFIVRMRMDYMDGIKTMKTIRHDTSYEKAPVIFLAPNLKKETIEECILSGAVYVIEKPYNPQSVAATVRVAMLKPEKLTFLSDYADYTRRDEAWTKLKLEKLGTDGGEQAFKSYLENELDTGLLEEIMGMIKEDE